MLVGSREWRAEKRLAMPEGVCSNYPYCSRSAVAGKKRCQACLDRLGEWRRAKRSIEAKVDGVCSVHDCTKPAEAPHKMCADCRTVSNSGVKRRNAALKAEVFAAYGSKCSCCGEAEQSFLSIDHVNGYDGLGPRKSTPLYRWLKKNGYPAGFQLLCMNCNGARGYYGYCPHDHSTVVDHDREFNAVRNISKKLEILARYGDWCSCCGEVLAEFLCIDHINNDGAEHRRSVGSGSAVYSWIKKNNFPPGFQVLCINCNFAKGHLGSCCHASFGNK